VKRTPEVIKQRAIELRQCQTQAEHRVWAELRSRRLGGYKFRRQHPIGQFITDFCCIERRLVLEIDGAIHNGQHERDYERTVALEGIGYTVVRWTNDDVELRLVQRLAELRRCLDAVSPLPRTGEGQG
jgi:very-short-patch-repair endonuclease